jgi:hypothetical protein
MLCQKSTFSYSNESFLAKILQKAAIISRTFLTKKIKLLSIPDALSPLLEELSALLLHLLTQQSAPHAHLPHTDIYR